MDIEVKVPATVANLGPGFDCLGVAVGLYLRLTVALAETTSITGGASKRQPSDSLVYTAFAQAHALVGVAVPSVKIEITDEYPSARGLGASASAIVAGAVSARAASDLDLSDEDLARLCTRIEGHSDNVLPALFGGLVLSTQDGWMRFEPTDRVTPVVIISSERFSTEKARSVLPADVPRSDAVANAAATASLVAVLAGWSPPDALLVATQDWLHEPYRLPLMPSTMDLHHLLRSNGVAAALSGAGPSIICLVPAEEAAGIEELARKFAPEGWRVASPGWDLVGATIK